MFFNPNNENQQNCINSLLQEMNILKTLNSTHIVRYLGSEIVDCNYCMYIEFLSGGSISSLLYKLGPLPEVTVKVYTRQILKGLKYLHENGVIHRDLKCDNLLFDSNGKIKLCDFGCSKQYENKGKNESGLLDSVIGSLP